MKTGPDLATGEEAVEILGKQELHKGFLTVERYTVRSRRYDGSLTDSYTRDLMTSLESGCASCVLPYDPVADKIILIEQFRLVHHVRERHSAWPLEIPGGLIKVGGDPVDTARREVEEETGRSLLRLEKITEFLPAAAEFTAVIHIYVGEIEAGEGGGVHGLEEEDENIKVHVLSPRDAIKLLDTGRIGDGKTQIALHWLARHHEALRTRWLAERA